MNRALHNGNYGNDVTECDGTLMTSILCMLRDSCQFTAKTSVSVAKYNLLNFIP